MSRSGMTAIKANTNKYFSLSHNFFYGFCAWTLACGVLFSGLKAEETPGNQLGSYQMETQLKATLTQMRQHLLQVKASILWNLL